MNEKAIEPLSIAVNVMLVCLFVSISFIIGRSYQKAIFTKLNDTQVINQQLVDADLASLTATDLTGAEVVSAVRKYKKDLTVTVSTLKGGAVSYTESSVVTNTDSEDPNYIMPDALFTANADKDLNGIYKALTFTQKGEVALVNDSELTVEKIKEELIKALHSSNNPKQTSFSQILEQIKNNVSVENKRALAAALPGMGVTENSSWNNLVSAATEYINSVEGAPALNNSYKEVQSGSISAQSSAELYFDPNTIVVSYEEGGSPKAAVYLNTVWYVNGAVVSNCPFRFTKTSCELKNNSGGAINYYAYK